MALGESANYSGVADKEAVTAPDTLSLDIEQIFLTETVCKMLTSFHLRWSNLHLYASITLKHAV